MGVNKILMMGTLFSLLFILMSSLSSAVITHEGDKIIYENQYGRISVYPENISSPVKKFTQYINLTSKLAQDKDMDFAMSFDNPIVDYNIFLQKNKTYNKTIYTYENVTVYPEDPQNGTTCSDMGYLDYNATNCITWEIQINGSYLEERTRYYWDNVKIVHTHKTNLRGGGKHWYITEDITFKAYSNKYIQWFFETSEPSGKWELYMKPSDKTWAEAEAQGVLFVIDPFWNASGYPFCSEILSNATGVYVINANDTYDPNIWTVNATVGEKIYVCCENSGCASGNVAIANETDQKNWENASSLTGYNPTLVYDEDQVLMAHLEDIATANDSTRYGYDGTKAGSPTLVSGVFGNGYNFTSTAQGYDFGDQIEFSGTQNNEITIMLWVKATGTSASNQNIISKFGNAPREWYISHVPNTNAVDYEFTGITNKMCRVGSSFGSTGGGNIGFAPQIGKWYLYTLQANVTDCWIYINATKYGDGQAHQGNEFLQDTNHKVYIGRETRAVNYLTDAEVDEVRIYNRTLSLAEITDIYYSGINKLTTLGAEESANTTPTVSLYNVTGNTTDTTPSIDFNYTDDDLSATCYLYFNDTAYDSNNTVQNATRTTLTANATLSLDDYEVKVSCYDGLNTGTSSPIILSIIPLPYLYITINSPENKTYSSLSIELNVNVNSSHNIDSVFYELNGINTSLWLERYSEDDDTEDAWAFNGTWSWGAGNGVDENWGFPYTRCEDGNNCYLWQNHTVPSWATGVNWTYALDCIWSSGQAGRWINWYWDYNNNSWEEIDNYICDNSQDGNHTKTIPSSGISGGVLQIRSNHRGSGVFSEFNTPQYYEGMATWYNGSGYYNATITAQDGSNDLTAYVNNTNGLLNSSRVIFSVTIPPSIDQVNVPSASLDPVEKSTTNVAINFTATGTYLDNTSAKFVLIKGATSYTDTVCEVTAIDSNTNRYNCDINLNYYDPAGVWTVNVSIDNSTANGLVYDDSETITYNSLTALQTNSSTLTFGTFNRASSSFIDTNQLENTGNVNLTTITVTGYDLRGVTDTSQFLYLSDSIFAVRQEGESYSDLINTTQVTVTNGVIDLYPSQYINLDFKITPANIPSINKAQVYQTETGLEWVISV